MAISTVFIASISLLLTLSHSFSIQNPTDRRILVVLEDLALKSSHSIFFNSLEKRGFELDFKLSDDPKIALQRYGQYLYDGLILFSPTAERFGGSLDVAAVLDFVDSGKDMILAADSTASDLIRNIAAECGVDFDEDPSSMVIDHGSFAVSETEGDHTLIAADDFIRSDVLLGTTKIEAPVLFKGIGHSLNPANNLVLKVLSASPSAYSANPKSKLSNPPSLSGSSISLVSVVQARNNARVVFSGSIDLFSNKFYKSPVQKAGSSNKFAKSGNEQFVTELGKWVFHERGHLKAVNVRHHRVGETYEPSIYRINDDLVYSVEIYEWSGSSWEPYVTNDVQIQFYMMSPYVLKTMSTDKKVASPKPLYISYRKTQGFIYLRVCIMFLLRCQMFMAFSSLRLNIRGLDTLACHLQNRFRLGLSDTMSMRDSSQQLFHIMEHHFRRWLDFSSSALYTFTASKSSFRVITVFPNIMKDFKVTFSILDTLGGLVYKFRLNVPVVYFFCYNFSNLSYRDTAIRENG